MCTTLFLLSTLAMLWRRRFANRVQPEPSGVDGAVMGSSLDPDRQASGRQAGWLFSDWEPQPPLLDQSCSRCLSELLSRAPSAGRAGAAERGTRQMLLCLALLAFLSPPPSLAPLRPASAAPLPEPPAGFAVHSPIEGAGGA
ncbi:photoreceptor disk component PRCD [Dugong dugon]